MRTRGSTPSARTARPLGERCTVARPGMVYDSGLVRLHPPTMVRRRPAPRKRQPSAALENGETAAGTTEPNASNCVGRSCPEPRRLEALADPPAPPPSAVPPSRPQVDLPPGRPDRRRACAPVPPLWTLRTRRPSITRRRGIPTPSSRGDVAHYSAGRGPSSNARSKKAITRRSYSRGRAVSPPVCPASGIFQIVLGSPAAR